jgi:hypothetical protein
MTSIVASMKRLSTTEKDALVLAKQCNRCNLCFEDNSTFASVRSIRYRPQNGVVKQGIQTNMLVIPLANCSCIDCPVTFARHRMRENELEAIAICDALNIL